MTRTAPFRRLSLLLIPLVSLPACQATTLGRDLCTTAQVQELCGISDGGCLDALLGDDTFRPNNLYSSGAVLLEDDDRCILLATDSGRESSFGFGGDDTGVARRFDVGQVQMTGALFRGRDADGDGLSNGDEAEVGSNPEAPDSDGDTVIDGDEAALGGSPVDIDTDDDGLDDGVEAGLGTALDDADTDGDGDSDAHEVSCNSSPLDAFFVCADHDEDQDGLTDIEEAAAGTDREDSDSDNDDLLDGDEGDHGGADPLNPDSDGDGILDGAEVVAGSDPTATDTDTDGVSDDAEAARGTDPVDADSDDDGDSDGAEVACASSPLDPAFTCANPPGEG